MHNADSFLTYPYIALQMSQLKAESMSMVGLNLFQQLSHLTRMANSSFDEQLSEDQVQ